MPPALNEFSRRFGLTARQSCVLRFLFRGVASKEIALALSISHSTARRHAEELYRKCGTRNQRELLALLARTLHEAALGAAGAPRPGSADTGSRRDVRPRI
jgi:DNA-binding NarL/FixJ family response regulator